MLICTNLPNLAEVGGSSGSPCRWSKHGTRKKNDRRHKNGGMLALADVVFLPVFLLEALTLHRRSATFPTYLAPYHLWFLPTPSEMPRTLVIPAHPLRDAPHTCVLTQKLDKMTKDGHNLMKYCIYSVTSATICDLTFAG